MYLGIDVGGTHTDAVIVRAAHDSNKRLDVVAQAKVATDHDNLLASVNAALEAVLHDVAPKGIRRVNLSTTLSTNAIVENKIEGVAVLVSGGPGLDPEHFRIGKHYYVLSGSIDHRGKEVAPLDAAALEAALARADAEGLKCFAAVTKFSTRNPAQEQLVSERIGAFCEGDKACRPDFVTLGHRLSGRLNFPRRIATAFYNAAVWRTYNAFADAVEATLRELGVEAAVGVLKADGGTMPLAASRELPVESILSGPAASVMGIIALEDLASGPSGAGDAIILDIGGTTTDIAVFASGHPVIEPDGIEVGSYPTLVRALKTHSIGVGGDSRLRVAAGKVRVGPDREGPPLCLGGAKPALMDAFNVAGVTGLGDVEASKKGLSAMAGLWDMFPEKLADEALATATASIKAAVDDMLWELAERPVYTISELLKDKRIRPRAVHVMGGPAAAFQERLAAAFGKEVRVPAHYQTANAIGAALTRTTMDIELFADTEKGVMLIPNLDVREEVGRDFDLARAEAAAVARLTAHLEAQGVTGALVEVTESSAFNMVTHRLVGKNIRVKCQVRPGIENL